MSDVQWLILIAISLYVVDSTVLLAEDEVLLLRGFWRWRVHFPTDQSRFLGKRLFIPNPFFPHQKMLRLKWGTSIAVRNFPDRDYATALDTSTKRDSALRPLQYLVLTEFAILILISLNSVWKDSIDLLFLTGVGTMYLVAACAISTISIYRYLLGISVSQILVLGSESLLCIPCSANILRKVTSMSRGDVDLLSGLRQVLPQDQYQHCLRQIVEEVERRIRESESGSPSHSELGDYLAKIQSELR